MSKWGTQALSRQNIAGTARAGAHGISRRVAEASARTITLWALGAVAAAAAVVTAVTFGTVHVSHQAPAFLQRSLGAAAPAAALVRVSEDGIRTGVTPVGLSFKAASGARMTLASQDVTPAGSAPQPWTRHANGSFRQTSFGNEAVVFNAAGQIEQLMTVGKHVGEKTWSWRLASTLGTPRVGDDGYVAFIKAHQIRQDIIIKPVVLYDARHQDITPAGARWSIARDSKGWLLQLKLNDKGFPLPYVIDPIAAGNVASSNTAGDGSSLVLTHPAGISNGDLIVAVTAISGTTGNFRIKTSSTSALFSAFRNSTQTIGPTNRIILWARIMQGTDLGSSWTFEDTLAGSQSFAASVAAFTGVQATTISGVDYPGVDLAPSSTTGYTGNGMTPNQDNELLVWGFAHRAGSGFSAASGGYTLAASSASTGGSNNTSAGLVWKLGTTAGTPVAGPTITPVTNDVGTALAAHTSFRVADNAPPTTANFKVVDDATITFDLDDPNVIAGLSASGVGVAPTIPPKGRFSVKYTPTGGGQTLPAISSATISGNTVTLTYPSGTFTTPGSVLLTYTNTPSTTGTTLNGVYTTSSPTMTVAGTGNFPTSGKFVVTGSTAQGPGAIAQVYTYSNKSATTFTVTPLSSISGTLASGNAVSNALQDRDGNKIATFTDQAVAMDGTGTIAISPNEVAAGSLTTQTLTYTVGAAAMVNGEVDITVPTGAGWTAPTLAAAAGKVSLSGTGSAGATLGVAGSTITITGVNATAGQTLIVTYGDTGGGGSQATAPGSAPQTNEFTTTQKTLAAGTLTAVVSQPSVGVVIAPDGSGTMAISPNVRTAGLTGQSFTLTYTANATPVAAMNDGEVDVVIPAGWTAPSLTSNAAGYVTASCQPTCSLAVTGQTVKVTGVTLAGGAAFTLNYGDTSGGGSGVTVPQTPGQTDTFTTTQRSLVASTLTALATQPTVAITGTDGSGTIAVTNSLVYGSSTNTHVFTYTLAGGGAYNGAVTVVVPGTWTTPQTSDATANAYITLGAGTAATDSISVSGNTITIDGITGVDGQTVIFTYGDTSGGAAGVVEPASAVVGTFTTQEKASAAGTLTSLASQPTITVVTDGSGTMTVSPTSALASTTTNTFTFTYTAGTGGMSAGKVSVTVPIANGWTTPQSSAPASAGYVTTSGCGGCTIDTTSTPGVIEIGNVTLGSGSQFDISFGTPNPNTGTTYGANSFPAKQQALSSGSLAALAASPSVTINAAADGATSCTVSPTSVNAGATTTLDFTCTLAAGGMNNGAIAITIPAGWTAPVDTPATAAGYSTVLGTSTATHGTLATSGQVITVPGITGTGGQTIVVRYGDTSSGANPGAATTAQSSAGIADFGIQDKATSGGALTTNTNSPRQVTVNGVDGAGSCAVIPTSVVRSTASTLTFTCTIGTGGMNGGKFELTIPAGWSEPQINTNTLAGYTTITPGPGSTATTPGTLSHSAATQIVTVDGITGTAGQTVVIVYGDPTVNASAKTIPPATTGVNTIGVKSQGSSTGSLVSTTPATISETVVGDDGAGDCAVTPTAVLRSTGTTLTFTCTIGTGGMTLGGFEITMPAGWTAPQTTPGTAGYTKIDGTSTASPSGSLGTAGQVITVTGVTGASGDTVVVIYGDTTGGVGGKGTPPGTAGPTTITTKSKGGTGGTFTPLSTSPLTVNVNGTDGAGTCTVTPTTAGTSAATTLTFECTIGTGGMNNGAFEITMPTGWTAPQTGSTSSAGYTKVDGPASTAATPGTVSTALQVITVNGVTGTAGQKVVVVYGDTTANAGGVATSGPTPGVNNIGVKSKGGVGGSPAAALVTISSSPLVVTLGGDGEGSCAVIPTSATGGTPVELTFTCTLGGTMTAGAFQVAIPSSWTTPQTGTATAPGFTALTGGNATSTGALAVSGQNVNVTGITGTVGQTVIFKYGYTGVGGVNPGAKADPPAGPETSPFPTKSKSTVGGTLTTTSPTPSVTVASGVVVNPPKPTGEDVDDTVVTLTFDLTLDTTCGVPSPNAFEVISSISGTHTVLAVSFSNGAIILTLDSPVTPGETAVAKYTASKAGSCKLKGTNGKDVDPFDQPLKNKGVTSGTGSTPVGIPLAVNGGTSSCGADDLFFMSAAYGSGKTVTLVFCREFDESVVAGLDAYQVSISSKGRQVPTKAVPKGSIVTLTLAQPLVKGDTAVVTYARPVESALVDKLKNKALSFVGAEIVNLTGGTGSTATTAAATAADQAAPPRLKASSPDDGITVPTMRTVTLAAQKPVTWTNVRVKLADGTTVKLPDQTGVTYSTPFQPTQNGPYEVLFDMVDDKKVKTSSSTNFSVFNPPPAPTVASAGTAPEVSKVTKNGTGGAIVASDGSASVAWPSTLFKQPTIITVQPLPVVDSPKGVPSITASFALGSIAIEVTARRAANGALITELDTPLHLEFPNGTPNGIPSFSKTGMSWTSLPKLASNELPAGQRDGYFRDAQNTVHVWTRHLTFFAILKPGPALKLIAAPHIWAINKRRTISFLIQSGTPVTGVAQLYVAHSKHNVTLWKPFKVKAGATVIRMYLPKHHKMLGKFELRAKFTVNGKKAIRKRTIDFLPKHYVTAKKPVVVRINGLNNQKNLAKSLRKFDRVAYYKTGPTSIPFIAIAKKRIDAVVIDLTRTPYDYNNRIGLIRNLRWIFPDLRIIVITSNKTMAAKADQWGADAVSKAPGGSYQLKLTIARGIARSLAQAK